MSCEDFHRQQLCIYRQDKTLNKDVIKLHKKNERKELQQHTERNTVHMNSSTGDFVIRKRLKLQLEVYTTYQVHFINYSIK